MLKSLAILSALILSPAVMAQDAPPPPPPSGGMPQPEQIFAFLDANKDGFIAKDEAQGPLVQYFGNIDADKDDKISLVELKTAMDAMRPPEPTVGGSE
ncbi:MAG: EF-hand domain-containing protein [Pseudomonadota bacterium]